MSEHEAWNAMNPLTGHQKRLCILAVGCSIVDTVPVIIVPLLSTVLACMLSSFSVFARMVCSAATLCQARAKHGPGFSEVFHSWGIAKRKGYNESRQIKAENQCKVLRRLPGVLKLRGHSKIHGA